MLTSFVQSWQSVPRDPESVKMRRIRGWPSGVWDVPVLLYGYSHTIVRGGARANHTIVWEKLYGRLYGINF
eukprot:COSAG02_NODE_45_length_45811_cov_83.565891_3_plen_71_part_00